MAPVVCVRSVIEAVTHGIAYVVGDRLATAVQTTLIYPGAEVRHRRLSGIEGDGGGLRYGVGIDPHDPGSASQDGLESVPLGRPVQATSIEDYGFELAGGHRNLPS